VYPEPGTVPEATVNGEVERAVGLHKVTVPPPPKPPVQVMVTAEIGTVAQLEKEVGTEYTCSFQGSLAVFVTPQETVVVLLPATSGVSGSVAAKIMGDGLAYTLKFPVSGFGPDRAGRGAGAFCTGFPVCAANNATIHNDSSMAFRQTRLRPRES
jgi:hypothetical protein